MGGGRRGTRYLCSGIVAGNGGANGRGSWTCPDAVDYSSHVQRSINVSDLICICDLIDPRGARSSNRQLEMTRRLFVVVTALLWHSGTGAGGDARADTGAGIGNDPRPGTGTITAAIGTGARPGWSGPTVTPVLNAAGVSGFSVDGAVSAPSFLVGNTQGGLDDDLAAWRVELLAARGAGVRLFGVCTDGTDLLGPVTVLSNRTRAMIAFVLSAVPDALVIPRIPIGAGPAFPRAVAEATTAGPGHATVLGYGSMTSEWAAAAAARIAALLQMLDVAFPGKIAGVHLAGLAAGEFRFPCPPETVAGYADYAGGFQAEFCAGRDDVGTPNAASNVSATAAIAATRSSCAVASALERCTASDGNLFVSKAAADYNRFLSRQVQRAISASAAAAKTAMAGKGLVIAFYGYLNELGAKRVAGSGHLALAELLADPNVDGIVSPYKYDTVSLFGHCFGAGRIPTYTRFNNYCDYLRGLESHGSLITWTLSRAAARPSLSVSVCLCLCLCLFFNQRFRQPVGPLASMGPMDSPGLHSKFWVSEDDTRTSLACPPGATSCPDAPPGWLDCQTSECDARLMRRNVLTSALHGSAVYAFDLRLGGWFGKPNGTAGNNTNTTTTAAIWAAAATARKAAEQLYALGDGDAGLQPEIAVFIDDASLAHFRADGMGQGHLDYLPPAEWLNDLALDATLTGAPIVTYHLRDLLLPKSTSIFAGIKLAIFPNAFLLDDELRSALAAFASAAKRTLTYYYAPGIVNPSDGTLDPNGVSAVVGCPLARGAGLHTLGSAFGGTRSSRNATQASSVHDAPMLPPSGAPDFTTLAGMPFGPTFGGQPAPSSGPDSAVSPWLHGVESAIGRRGGAVGRNGSSCNVLARYVDGQAGSVVWAGNAETGGGVLFSSSPLPPAALRLLAESAGVHMYLDTSIQNQTGCNGDGVDARGAGLLLRGGARAGVTGAAAGTERRVALPRVSTVTTELGDPVCTRCTAFTTTLAAGELKLFYVQPGK